MTTPGLVPAGQAPAPRRPRRRALPAVGAAFLLATVGGCASGPTSSGSSAREELARMAERQRRQPVRQAMQAPPAPGIRDAALAPTSDPQRAFMPLDEALTHVVESPAPTDAGAAPPDVRDEALRRYIAGRSARLAGDLTAAAEHLEEAARLDPSAAAPWRELAELHLARGDRLAAAAAYRRALQRDPGDVRTLVRLGLWALDRRQPEDAASRLGAAWPRLDDADPALRHIVGAALGRALRDLGYLSAGVEASRRALELPEPFPAPTTFERELQSVYRNRSDEWRDVGDAELRLDRYGQALQAYEQASTFESLDPGSLLPRQVHASMRIGAPAAAAQAILDDLRAASGAIETRHLPLIRHVRNHSDVGPLLAAGIAQFAQSLPAEERRIAAGRIVRARAAASPPAEAAALLRDRLAQAPGDRGALVDLLGRVQQRGRRALVAQTMRLIARAPLHAATYAEGLLRIAPQAQALLDALGAAETTAPDAAKSLLESHLLLAAGRRAEAEAELRTLLEDRPNHAAAVVALTGLLAEAGRTQEARSLLERLDGVEAPRVRFARAQALRSLRLPAQALDVLAPLLDAEATPEADPSVRVDALLLAANLAQSLDDPEDAERWLLRAAEIDPSQEQIFAGLIALYAPDGALADRQALSEAVRRLRQAAPSSRTLRWLRAQELTAAGRYDQAEEDLLSLAEEELTAPIVELLTTIWMRTGSADRAESWLMEQRAAHPNSPAPVLALARLYAETERAALAVDVLQQWLDERPADVAVARRLESILRDPLGRVEEADRLAIERLEREPPSVGRALELVPVLVRRGETQRAVDGLLDALKDEPPLNSSQRRDFANAVLTLSGQAMGGALEAEDALRLHRIAQERFDALPFQLHASHMALLASSDAEENVLLDAMAAALEDAPGRADELTTAVGQTLLRRERQATALLLVDYAGEMSPAPGPQLLYQWYQLAVVEQDADSASRALRRMVEENHVRQIAQALQRQRFRSNDEAAAELAFVAGAQIGVDATAQSAVETMYRLALEFNRDHVMANNNLGYSLIERDENLEEARVLVERAYRQAPQEASVVDSMAWVQYKFGKIADVTNEAGQVVEQGAVTLLRRAVKLLENDGQPDPIVFDHLGDALWLSGERQEARRRWVTARSLVEERSARQLVLTPEERQALLDSINQKIDAAAAGADPPVATYHAPLNIDQGPAAENEPENQQPAAQLQEDAPAKPGGAN